MVVARAMIVALAALFFAGFSAMAATVTTLRVVINLPSRTLTLYDGDVPMQVFPVAIGKPSTPTPLGDFSIQEKEMNPWWYPPRGEQSPMPSGPDNPLGYRWMGFLPTYGIHGTNAPWTIGMAVSNGCVRMYEEDAEQLFSVVTVGTPVTVIYERVQVRVTMDGRVLVAIYPDVYGYRGISVWDVKEKLVQHGLAGLLDDVRISRLLARTEETPVEVARVGRLWVNGQAVASRVLVQDKTVYVPVWAVATALKRDIRWDQAGATVFSGMRGVPGVVIGEILYVNKDDLPLLFGGRVIWQPEQLRLSYVQTRVILNGAELVTDVATVNGVPALPVLPLLEALRLVPDTLWQPRLDKLLVHKIAVPHVIIRGEPYIKITDIYQVVNCYVYWNSASETIELTYPSPV